MFDYYLLNINLEAGQEQVDLPSLFVAVPPRRAQRSRAGDQLVFLASFGGSSEISPAKTQDILQRLSNTYYTEHGSITNGLRTVAEQLNEILLKLNLQESREGKQTTAVLNLAVVHNDFLYLAHAGSTHSVIVSQNDVQDFTDPQASGRTLGLSKSIALRFFQAQLQPGDILILSDQPPEGWTSNTLSGSTKLPMDHFRRRLLSLAGPDIQAAVIQVQPGQGRIHWLKPRSSMAQAGSEIASTAPTSETGAAPEPAPRPVIPTMAVPFTKKPEPPAESPEPGQVVPPEAAQNLAQPPVPSEIPAPTIQASVLFPPLETKTSLPAASPVPVAQPPQSSLSTGGIFLSGDRLPVPEKQEFVQPALVADQSPTAVKSTPPKVKNDFWKPFRRRLSAALQAGKTAKPRPPRNSAAAMVARLIPGKPEPNASLPASLLLFIAIAVPLAVVAISLTVYFQSGASQQYQIYFQQAQEYAAQAPGLSDSVQRRNAWSQTIYWIDKAEGYKQTADSRALRAQAQQMLDSMDGITRLDLQTALPGGFSNSVDIVHMAALNGDVYGLDSTQGRVLRMFMTGTGYEVDPQFSCGPGPSGSLIIGHLVDLATLPPGNSFGATVLAIDSTGNLLYCIPGSPPVSAALPPPDKSLGSVTSLTLDQGDLYVLDTQNNAVWIYSGQNLGFGDRPQLFFDTPVPHLADVIDMAENDGDLYLLHEDGRMTMCTYKSAAFASTRCQDPAKYGDQRPGHSGQLQTFMGAHFIQMETTQPPDPSLYVLDTSGDAIYHFSLRLNLQKQLRPEASANTLLPSGPPSAFTITSDRVALFAYGNLIYSANLP
ncbi:MAG: hypothetical protein P4L50_17100 [Anaerolineaceae bacterium]|nr:hypothetical protein [Anaerolineaceae bacterium]